MQKLAILTLAAILPTAASAQSVWMHNRSEMLLETNGGNLIISYLTPREGLSAQPGDYVVYGSFDDTARKNGVSGIARVFSAKCGGAGYEVSGEISDDKKTITLIGDAPIRDANCRITRFRSDKLVFTYSRDRGELHSSFIGEWSANKSTCDENESQEGPMLTSITPRGLGFYETYCAFSQIRGTANQIAVSMTCSFMDSKTSTVKGLKNIAPRIIEVETRDGPSAGAKQTLYKCPIFPKDASQDPSAPANLKTAKDEYFDRISLESSELIKGTMYNWPKQSSGGRR